MMPLPVIAVFDIGKTNKKFFLFNEQYEIVLERNTRFAETTDEDGYACDDVVKLSAWVKQTLAAALALPEYTIRALNFSAYGASFVHIDEQGMRLTPLYNYLKPYPLPLQQKFYNSYGGRSAFSSATASPVLGNLNSGLQLYRLKYEQPGMFARIQYALHLPQYLSYLVTGKAYADITSIGCHTGLWDFEKNGYHHWVYAEQVEQKLAPVFPCNETIPVLADGKMIRSGIGLHDSSAALIPYLACFSTPFVLVSTGTWCISMNPFNKTPLTAEEMQQDCLCYLDYGGRAVKASRLFAGNEHEEQLQALAAHFGVDLDHYRQVVFDPGWLKNGWEIHIPAATGLQASGFSERDLSGFHSYSEAYHMLVFDLIRQQKLSTSLVLTEQMPARIFVDGGFAKNTVYMNFLAAAFPGRQVFAASVSQATAVGAALAIHADWNSQPVPADIISLKEFTITK